MTLREISIQIANYCYSQFGHLDVDFVLIGMTPGGSSNVLTTLEDPEVVKSVLLKNAATYGSSPEEILPIESDDINSPRAN